MNPYKMWCAMDRSDRYMLISSVVAPLIVWWFYIGRPKYGIEKGMK